jgi:hypothetical protein
MKRKALGKRRQSGVYTVEFAIVGSLFFFLLLAVIEVGRLLYTWNVLTEASRRSARLATVCDLDQINIEAPASLMSAALFNDQNIIQNLTSDNLELDYLTLAGEPAVEFNDIALVRASIVNYQHQMLIPGLELTLNSPSFSSTLYRESLGVTRQEGVYTSCPPTGG